MQRTTNSEMLDRLSRHAARICSLSDYVTGLAKMAEEPEKLPENSHAMQGLAAAIQAFSTEIDDLAFDMDADIGELRQRLGR